MSAPSPEPKKKDHTDAAIFGLVVLMFLCVIFFVAFEIMKFAALVKWLFA